ncbi:MAG: SDR family NAD(P)-dependent oxidoreductase [Acidobacteriota bacterium]|nr:SDR family NAD(P)-dependent oxidoreductase [Acidobacteriota bacterium]
MSPSERRVAVVTGASSGIGEATARLLAADGWRVVLVARRAERLQGLADDIGAAGGEAMVEALDAADGLAVDAMAERVFSQWGSPSLVVNSAGAGVWRFLEETAPAQTVEMIGAPYLAAANICRAFMAGMLAAGRGHFIHIGSPASLMPWPGATAYTASRWALRGLHEALCMDLIGTGVTSSLVYFGEVSSGYFEANPDSRQYIPAIGRWVPLSTPESCAEVVLGVVRRPRRVVFHPFQLRLMWWLANLSPGPTRWLIARTGRRH